jgi:hypothetical protein
MGADRCNGQPHCLCVNQAELIFRIMHAMLELMTDYGTLVQDRTIVGTI